VAKTVTLIAVRVLDCDGNGDDASVIAGVDWVTAHAARPAVANMSIGGPPSQSLDAAVRRSIATGISYGIAAGNGDDAGHGYSACDDSPARVKEALIVGATGRTDYRAAWSNYGGCVDLFAPGVGILSSWGSGNSATSTLSGTSMAAPHVSGAAALYLAAYPSAGPSQVQQALRAAATVGRIRGIGPDSPNRLLRVV
jgi:subtilisin family serine protease